MMNSIRRLVSILKACSGKTVSAPVLRDLPRGFTSLTHVTSAPHIAEGPYTKPLLPVEPLILQPCRQYKVKTKLKKFCRGCYLEKRFGRLYVECTLKPRHKQMLQQSGLTLFRDDYSTKNWKKAVHWGHQNNVNYYKQGDNEFSKFNWLDGKLGKTV